MQKFLVATQFICVSLFVFGCGGTDEQLSEEEARDKYSCKLIEGPEGSDEYILKCGDESATGTRPSHTQQQLRASAGGVPPRRSLAAGGRALRVEG